MVSRKHVVRGAGWGRGSRWALVALMGASVGLVGLAAPTAVADGDVATCRSAPSEVTSTPAGVEDLPCSETPPGVAGAADPIDSGPATATDPEPVVGDASVDDPQVDGPRVDDPPADDPSTDDPQVDDPAPDDGAVDARPTGEGTTDDGATDDGAVDTPPTPPASPDATDSDLPTAPESSDPQPDPAVSDDASDDPPEAERSLTSDLTTSDTETDTETLPDAATDTTTAARRVPVEAAAVVQKAAAEPVASPDTTSGLQRVTQSVDALANDVPGDPGVPLVPSSLTLIDGPGGDAVNRVVVPDQGTYTVAGGRLVFTPLEQFTGPATPADYRVVDTGGTSAESTYTPTVQASTGPATPRLTVTKSVSSPPTNVSAFRYDLTYRIVVGNSGNVPLTGITLADDLGETFEGARAVRVLSTASDDVVRRRDYDGVDQTQLLLGSDSLAPGESVVVLVTVRVAPGDVPGPYLNTAVGGATCSTCSTALSDRSDSAVPGAAFDPDDMGHAGAPGDTGGGDDPTPVFLTEGAQGELAFTGASLPVGTALGLVLAGVAMIGLSRTGRRRRA